MTTPVLSLVTGKVERHESFHRLVDSITRYTDVDWELVVADASEVPYQTTDPRIRVIHEQPKLGYVHAYNRAFGECTGTWVLFLNDDAEVTPKYATEAIAFMESHPQIGLGALYYSNRGRPFMVNELEGMVYANFGILSREFGKSFGFFDNELRMYGSDNALAFRVLLFGKGVAGIPNARIIHHEIDDALRRANQFDRYPEADKLKAKYLPWKHQMLRTYRRALLA